LHYHPVALSGRPPIAILFDLDGTLVDTVPFILAAVRHAFEGYGSCPTDAQWLDGIGTPLRVQLASFARGPDDVEPLLARYRAYWIAHHDRMTRLFPGAMDVVVELASRGHPLGIVTAKTEEGAIRTLRHTGLLRHLGAIVGADTCPRCKPDPAPVRVALARLGRAPGEALLVGDSIHDVVAAREAGVRAVGVTWGVRDREALAHAGADACLDDLRELPALVAAHQSREGDRAAGTC
jgi:pyrophosphatase PpaX